MEQNNGMKRPIIDMVYSFTAYALPTFTLQFLVLPLIAGRLSTDENGLFLALFNAIRLCVSIFIVPLSNLRLLKKKECINRNQYDKAFNFLFLLVTSFSVMIVLFLGIIYREGRFDYLALSRLIIVLVLLAAHDYYAITFRIDIAYKSILIDNLLIVTGYLFGICLMWRFGYWESIFICGYSFGLIYTLLKSKLWRKGVDYHVRNGVITEYSLLCVSSGMNNATTYCDKMLIYPLIGGYSVSVYNAAAVASKMMSLVSVPLRNVVLSYIVEIEKVVVPTKKRKKIGYLVCGLTAIVYGVFYLAGVVFCRILYPQYFAAALRYIPIILLAILLETYAGLLKVYLLRFENTMLQVLASCTKVFLYFLSVLVLNVVFKMGLMGFCVSILVADSIHFVVVLFYFVKNIRK